MLCKTVGAEVASTLLPELLNWIIRIFALMRWRVAAVFTASQHTSTPAPLSGLLQLRAKIQYFLPFSDRNCQTCFYVFLLGCCNTLFFLPGYCVFHFFLLLCEALCNKRWNVKCTKCLSNSPKPKDYSFSSRTDEEKRPNLTSEKLKLSNGVSVLIRSQ